MFCVYIIQMILPLLAHYQRSMPASRGDSIAKDPCNTMKVKTKQSITTRRNILHKNAATRLTHDLRTGSLLVTDHDSLWHRAAYRHFAQSGAFHSTSYQPCLCVHQIIFNKNNKNRWRMRERKRKKCTWNPNFPSHTQSEWIESWILCEYHRSNRTW